MKRIQWRIILFLLILFLCHQLFSMRLMTLDKALQKMMPEADRIENVDRILTSDELSAIRRAMGGMLVLHQKEGENSVRETNQYTFYFGMQNGRRERVAIVESQPGKMGPVEFMVVLNAGTGKVMDLAVMSYEESRGRSIARKNFLRQFTGLGKNNPIRVREDIRGITGATISSNATCFAVKKAAVLYDVLFLKG